jgi:hypothetical protein
VEFNFGVTTAADQSRQTFICRVMQKCITDAAVEPHQGLEDGFAAHKRCYVFLGNGDVW